MVHDLRVKAVARAPRRSAVRQAARGASSDDGSDSSYCPPADIGSEEEWEDSASSASSHASQPKQGRTEALGHPRTPRVADEEEQEVAPPPLTKREFGSWVELESYLSEYSTASNQSFRVRTNNKVSTRNKKIKESGSTKPLVSEELVFYGKTFVCTHAGKYNARGQGKRKLQQSRALECEAQINACVQVVDINAEVPEFVVRFTTWRLYHNHGLSEHTFRQYPRNRNALESEVLATVDTLRKNGASKKRIQQYIHENSVCTSTNQDFHVIKYLREEIASAAYGFNAWQKQQLQGVVQLLVYAKTEQEYKRLRDYMHYIMGIGRRSASGRTELGPGSSELGAGGAELGAGSAELESEGAEVNAELGAGRAELGADAESNDDAPQHPFEAYFDKNWDKCRSVWCAFERLHRNGRPLLIFRHRHPSRRRYLRPGW
uniref:FAR1 domain-containing protein n=1 Tax=Phytophthora fragariae TaxID=53985 RepID=A0A6A3G136_9STRA|nr:hypothetical protein PF009_g14 [Phytophthora fragariae]